MAKQISLETEIYLCHSSWAHHSVACTWDKISWVNGQAHWPKKSRVRLIRDYNNLSCVLPISRAVWASFTEHELTNLDFIQCTHDGARFHFYLVSRKSKMDKGRRTTLHDSLGHHPSSPQQLLSSDALTFTALEPETGRSQKESWTQIENQSVARVRLQSEGSHCCDMGVKEQQPNIRNLASHCPRRWGLPTLREPIDCQEICFFSITFLLCFNVAHVERKCTRFFVPLRQHLPL